MEALNQHEHPFESLKRIAGGVLSSFAIKGWSELQGNPNAYPLATILKFPKLEEVTGDEPERAA